MAENDRFPVSPAPGWRSACKLMSSGLVTDEEVGHVAVKALARSLRDLSGVPGFGKVLAIAVDYGKPLLGRFSRLDEICRLHGGHVHTVFAAEAAKSLIASQNEDLAQFVIGQPAVFCPERSAIELLEKIYLISS